MTSDSQQSLPAAQDRLPRSRALPGWLITVLLLFLAAAMPAFLVLTGVRLVMSEAFIWLEYNRPGFPADRYGFSKAERLKYAPYAVRYLLNGANIDYLGDLTFDDGEPLYTADELKHMEDVKVVTRGARRVHTLLSVAFVAAILALAWQRETRWALRRGLADGGIFTIFLMVTLAVFIFASWDLFFEGFHRIFFKGNSWQFSNSDTLIRLFPEQFWFDAALSIGVMTLGGAVGAIWGMWYWERQLLKVPQALSPTLPLTQGKGEDRQP